MIFEIIITVFMLVLTTSVLMNRGFSPVLKIFLFFVFMAGVFFAYFPEVLDDVAMFLGVEAGSDLVFYATTMLIIYTILVIYQKTMAINKRIEMLNRHLAIYGAVKPDK